MDYEFNTAKEKIPLEILAAEEAEEVPHNREPECLGPASQAWGVSSNKATKKQKKRYWYKGYQPISKKQKLNKCCHWSAQGKSYRIREKRGSALPKSS